MQFKTLFFIVPLMATLAMASPTPTGVSQCNTGTISCCNTVQSASSSPVSSLLGLLGIVVGDVTALVGLGCTPLSVIGIGSGVSCTPTTRLLQ
ncbi:sc3 hydrophobin [Clathrus columnatus]|uniref:Hydrophobin n=1 Tax=Clathrus columnatus TaxID=1419009 RepID=A0AAV5ANJ8_9AGAM|nr:sc3 hydrophobin [Clathrus columnatus]